MRSKVSKTLLAIHWKREFGYHVIRYGLALAQSDHRKWCLPYRTVLKTTTVFQFQMMDNKKRKNQKRMIRKGRKERKMERKERRMERKKRRMERKERRMERKKRRMERKMMLRRRMEKMMLRREMEKIQKKMRLRRRRGSRLSLSILIYCKQVLLVCFSYIINN